jgi:GT2 family glycosyltransferase
MISIIVPVYKNKTLVEYCLSSIERWRPNDSELIVVDDASGQETLDTIKKFNRIKLIVHDENKGNTIAYNTGANMAKGDVLVFIDSDILIFDKSLHKIKRFFNESKVNVLGTLLLYPYDNTIQHAGVAFDKWTLSHIYAGNKVGSVKFKFFESRQAVTAAFFACRKTIFNEVGGFDVTYRDGLEDIDFCLKCKEKGIDIIFSPNVQGYHFESASRGAFKSIRRTYNYSIFFSRWYGKFEPDLNLYITRSLSALFGANSSLCMLCLNFCNTPNWSDLIVAVQQLGIRIIGVHNMSGFISEYEPIDLYRAVPIAIQKSTYPLLFTVDHFAQLEKNCSWFKQRQATDLIVDRHANVLQSSDWKTI